MSKKMDTAKVLKTWLGVNKFVQTATEEQVEKLLEAEQAGAKRPSILLRLHSRLNKLRADRERQQLLGGK